MFPFTCMKLAVNALSSAVWVCAGLLVEAGVSVVQPQPLSSLLPQLPPVVEEGQQLTQGLGRADCQSGKVGRETKVSLFSGRCIHVFIYVHRVDVHIHVFILCVLRIVHYSSLSMGLLSPS